MNDLRDFIALSLLPAKSRLRAVEQLRAGCHPGVVLEHLLSERLPLDPDRLATLHQRAVTAIGRAAPGNNENNGNNEHNEHNEHRAHHILALMLGHEGYPATLNRIDDPPLVLWTASSVAPRRVPELPAFAAPAVAIVGSRAASSYALAVAEKLAADLAARGIVIVSGLARGVDAAAHRGALSVSGLTIAVLGCGVDVIYPPEHALLARSIAMSGALVSELVPGTRPQPWCFPMRNRIISGLARAVVVIEAAEKSGALITARCALDQGREVLAVPGNILNGRNRGAHGLLRDGAKIVESADDILEELGMRGTVRSSGNDQQEPGTDPILAYLAVGQAMDLDSIAERSGLSAARLLPRLLELELQGTVARVPSGWIREG